MSEKTEHFYVRTGPTLIEGFRAFRASLERMLAAEGKSLDPAWYDDGPDEVPHLYKDQPHLLSQREGRD